MTIRKDITLRDLQNRLKGHLPGLIGIEMLKLEDGVLESKLKIKEDLLAPNGFLHAATLVALADTTCGFGAISHLPENAVSFTTIELKSNFLGTQTEGNISCKARLVHSGKTTQVWDATIYNEGNKAITLFRCTQLLIY